MKVSTVLSDWHQAKLELELHSSEFNLKFLRRRRASHVAQLAVFGPDPGPAQLLLEV
jgi:hypothetical protein